MPMLKYSLALVLTVSLLTSFDARTGHCLVLDELWRIPNLPGPSEVYFSETSRVFYVSSRTDRKLIVIKPLTGDVIRVVDLHFSPGVLEVSSEGRRVYVEHVDEATISILATDSLSEIGVVRLGRSPSSGWNRTWRVG